MGEPDKAEGRYAIIEFAQQNSGNGSNTPASIIIHFDDDQNIISIKHLWANYRAETTTRYDYSEWQSASNIKRAEMAADLVERWPGGELSKQLATSEDVVRLFSEADYVDYIHYISDTSTYETIVFKFDHYGKVSDVESSYID